MKIYRNGDERKKNCRENSAKIASPEIITEKYPFCEGRKISPHAKEGEKSIFRHADNSVFPFPE